MALIRMNFFSNALGMCVPATVLLPEKTRDGLPHPVLWLLHGAGGDHTDWTRNTAIERYVSGGDLAVVMPSAHMSRYRDMAHGGKFATYIADELPQIMRSFFPLSAKREHNFICGLSMGGQGALRLGLTHPDRYAAIGCLSAGASNFRPDEAATDPNYQRSLRLVFGEADPAKEMEEVLALAQRIADANSPAPRVYHACGEQDFLLAQARQTRDFFRGLSGNPFDYTYVEGTGAHTWTYWDAHIQRFLEFIGHGDQRP